MCRFYYIFQSSGVTKRGFTTFSQQQDGHQCFTLYSKPEHQFRILAPFRDSISPLHPRSPDLFSSRPNSCKSRSFSCAGSDLGSLVTDSPVLSSSVLTTFLLTRTLCSQSAKLCSSKHRFFSPVSLFQKLVCCYEDIGSGLFKNLQGVILHRVVHDVLYSILSWKPKPIFLLVFLFLQRLF